MNRVASQLLGQLESAIGSELKARKAVQNSLRIQATLLRALRAEKISTNMVAARVIKVLGLPPGMESRNRIADRLRQRASRVTRCHRILSGAHGVAGVAAIAFDEKEAAKMPKAERRLVRRITEEFIEEEEASKLADHDEVDDDEVDDDDEDEESNDETSSRPTKRRSRKY